MKNTTSEGERSSFFCKAFVKRSTCLAFRLAARPATASVQRAEVPGDLMVGARVVLQPTDGHAHSHGVPLLSRHPTFRHRICVCRKLSSKEVDLAAERRAGVWAVLEVRTGSVETAELAGSVGGGHNEKYHTGRREVELLLYSFCKII